MQTSLDVIKTGKRLVNSGKSLRFAMPIDLKRQGHYGSAFFSGTILNCMKLLSVRNKKIGTVK